MTEMLYQHIHEYLLLHVYAIPSYLGAQAFGKSHFENSSSVAGLTNVQCNGSESTWISCSYSEDPQCGNSEFAGVQCDGLVGDCEAAGFTSCCIFGCNEGDCYCDAYCHGIGHCCGDIEKICLNDGKGMHHMNLSFQQCELLCIVQTESFKIKV